MNVARGYHSAAVLLLDGSVLMGGDNPRYQGYATRHERYFPPYFYGPQVRPRIIDPGAPLTQFYGDEFNVTIDPAYGENTEIHEVAIISPGAVTHGFNMSQRYIELEITGRSGNDVLKVKVPSSAKVAPPGWYILVVTKHPSTCPGNGDNHHEGCTQRTPSEGIWIRITLP